MKRAAGLSPLLCLAALAGCGDDPVAYSAPVGINLNVKSDDTRNSAVASDKNINSESGNPYAAFVSEARRRLGRDPSRIGVSSLTLLLGGQSTGVTTLDQVFAGRVDALFVMNDTNNSFNVGHADSVRGGGPVAFQIDFDSAAVVGVDRDKLLGGSFKVTIRGAAATTFVAKGSTANLQLTSTFAAYP